MNRFYPPSIHETVVDYQLRDGDVVLDVGGYHGEWTAVLLQRNPGVQCRSFVFEPVEEFHAVIQSRFIDNSDVTALNVALSDHTGYDTIVALGEGSHLGDSDEGVIALDVVDFFRVYGVDEVSLASINIEGHEYALLTRLLDSGLIGQIDRLQIQFHETLDNAGELRDEIRARLSETHEEVYCYPFVWESWRKK
jgi:FkbM family methyltransferase